MKKLFKRLSITSFALTVFLSLAVQANATANNVDYTNTTIKTIDDLDTLTPTSKSTKKNSTTYYFNDINKAELEIQLENELNSNLDGPVGFNASAGYYDLVEVGSKLQSTGAKKMSGQLPGGVSFQNGGTLYYKDGSSYSVPVSVSISGVVFGISAGIGSYSSKYTIYGIKIPSGSSTRRYHGYVNKTYNVTLYKKYWVNPATGHKIYQGYTNAKTLHSMDFTYQVVK